MGDYTDFEAYLLEIPFKASGLAIAAKKAPFF